MAPDLSPTMLRVFLTGRTVHRKWADGVSGSSAWARTVADLVARTGLPRAVVAGAFKGRVTDPDQINQLWAALGVEGHA